MWNQRKTDKLLKRFTSVLFEFLETVLTSVFILVIVYVFIAFPVMVQGKSMEPTLFTGDRLLVETITSRFFGYQRGEIVVLSANVSGVAGLANELLVKRVIGLPGDRVKIYNCKVHIFKDGEIFKVSEVEYLPQEVCTVGGRQLEDGRPYTIPEGQYLVLGDNRSFSNDSRAIGFVKSDNIQGKVVFLFYPFGKISLY